MQEPAIRLALLRAASVPVTTTLNLSKLGLVSLQTSITEGLARLMKG
jgi:hypothetical protein